MATGHPLRGYHVGGGPPLYLPVGRGLSPTAHTQRAQAQKGHTMAIVILEEEAKTVYVRTALEVGPFHAVPIKRCVDYDTGELTNNWQVRCNDTGAIGFLNMYARHMARWNVTDAKGKVVGNTFHAQMEELAEAGDAIAAVCTTAGDLATDKAGKCTIG